MTTLLNIILGRAHYHVTANRVLSLAQRSREIFESSEMEEKRQLLVI